MAWRRSAVAAGARRGGSRFERGSGIARPRRVFTACAARRPPARSPSASPRAVTLRAGARARRSCWSHPGGGGGGPLGGAGALARWARHPVALALFGLAVTLAGWTADAYVLPRLYPAFHVATLARCLLGRGARGARGPRRRAAAGQVARRGGGRGGGARGALRGRGTGAGRCGARPRREPPHRPRRARAARGAARWQLAMALAARRSRGRDRRRSLRPRRARSPARSTGPGTTSCSSRSTRCAPTTCRPTATRARRRRTSTRSRARAPVFDARVLPDAAHVVLAHVDDDGQVPAAAPGARPGRGLGDVGPGPAALRLAHRRRSTRRPCSSSTRTASRASRTSTSASSTRRWSSPTRRCASSRCTEYLRRGAARTAALSLGALLRAARALRRAPGARLHGRRRRRTSTPTTARSPTADDGIGRIVRAASGRARPGAVVIVTADHGEEFGEHGGRYHGTTVYEEQVRVPLVVVGPGVRAGQRVRDRRADHRPLADDPLGARHPAAGAASRARPRAAAAPGDADGGRRGPGSPSPRPTTTSSWPRGADRLVCERRAAACALYDLARRSARAARPRRPATPARFARCARAARGRARPRALRGRRARRRGRRRCGAACRATSKRRRTWRRCSTTPTWRSGARRPRSASPCTRRRPSRSCERALARDEDDEVRRWAALALARTGEPLAAARRRAAQGPGRASGGGGAALALGERGDARGCDELAAWWSERVGVAASASPTASRRSWPIDLRARARAPRATAQARCRAAVPRSCRALEDVRARPYVADALGALGDDRARAPLLAAPGERALRHDPAARGARAPRARGPRLVGAGASRRPMVPRRRVARAAPGPAGRSCCSPDPARRPRRSSADGEPTSARPERRTRARCGWSSSRRRPARAGGAARPAAPRPGDRWRSGVAGEPADV